MRNTKQVIVMRKDLNMRKGKMVAQGSHASLAVFVNRGVIHNGTHGLHIQLTEPMIQWLDNSFTKVCVYVESEKELLDIYDAATRANLPRALIRDAGHTEFKEPTYTCCAIGPDLIEAIDLITGKLPLL